MSHPEPESIEESLSLLSRLAVEHGFVPPDRMREMLAATGKLDTTTLGSRLVNQGHVRPRELEILYELAACEAVGDAEGAAEAVARLKAVRKPESVHDTTTLDPEIANALSDPKRQFGKFVLLNELGRGGMGIVYRAWQTDLRRVVALKVLPSDLADGEERARFEREARTAAQLNHSNIVRVIECGQHDGKPYFTMDYIEGKPLSSMVRDGDLTSRQAIEICAQAALALHFAHEHGVVHRDVKPANLLIDRKGVPFLADFGLAKSSSDFSMTHTGMVMGSPYYMSPEQAQGRTKEIDHRTDIYSLGAVLYQAVTGQYPFNAENFGLLFDLIREARPVPPSERVKGLPKDLDAVVLRCLEKKPDRRYKSAFDLAADLKRVLMGQRIDSKPAPAKGPPPKTTRIPKVRPAKSPVGPIVAGVVGVVALVGILAAVAMNSKGPARPGPAQPPSQPVVHVPKPPPARVPDLPLPTRTPQPTPSPSTVPTPSPTPAEDSALIALETKVQELAGQGEFGEALRRLEAYFPKDNVQAGRVSRLRARIHGDAKAAWDKADELGVRAAGAGDRVTAEQTYQKVVATSIDLYVEMARQRLSSLETMAGSPSPSPSPDPSPSPSPSPPAVPEAEAKTALDALFDAEKRKDWKKCRELLAARDRFADSECWKQASAKVDDIAFASAEVSEETSFAVRPKKSGSQLEWRYEFPGTGGAKDWGMTAPDIALLLNATMPHGSRVENNQLWFRNARMQFAAALDGDAAVSAEAVLAERGKAILWLEAGGYVFRVLDGNGGSELVSPNGQRVAWTKISEPSVGRPFRILLRLSRGACLAMIDDQEVFRGSLPEAARPGPVAFQTAQDTAAGLRRISVAGSLKSPEEHRARTATLAQIGRAFPYASPQVLCDGKGFGRLRKEEQGTWESVDGALKGVSPDKNRGAELFGPAVRNVRLKVKYRVHSGLFLDLSVRQGDGQMLFQLPCDPPETWRALEIVVAESAVQAHVDGVTILPQEVPRRVDAGDIRLRIKNGSASIKDMTIEEIRNVPAETLVRREEAAMAVVSGAVATLVDGKWTRAPRFYQGLPFRAEGRTVVHVAGATVQLEGGSRFTVEEHRLRLDEGTVAVTAWADAPFRLELGDQGRIKPGLTVGRVIYVARPDRMISEEGFLKWGENDVLLSEGVEYLVKDERADPSKTRTLPAAPKPRESVGLKFDGSLKGRLKSGKEDVVGGRRALKASPIVGNEYYYASVDFDAEPAELFAVKERTAFRFRVHLVEATTFTLQIWDEALKKNMALAVEAPPDQWFTLTLPVRTFTHVGGEPGFPVPGNRITRATWLVGKPKIPALVAVADAQLIELEK